MPDRRPCHRKFHFDNVGVVCRGGPQVCAKVRHQTITQCIISQVEGLGPAVRREGQNRNRGVDQTSIAAVLGSVIKKQPTNEGKVALSLSLTSDGMNDGRGICIRRGKLEGRIPSAFQPSIAKLKAVFLFQTIHLLA